MDFFRFGLFLNSSATDIVLVTLPNTAVETAIALVAAQWRGDTALPLPLCWRRSTVSPVFFGRSSFHSLAPPPPVPDPNKQPRFCGRKAKWSQENITVIVNTVDCSAMRFGQRGLIAMWLSGSQRLTTDDVRKYTKPQRWPQGEGRKLVLLWLYI